MFGEKNLFFNQQAITTDGTSDVIHHDEGGGGNVGDGDNLKVVIQVTEDFTAAGAATLTITFQDSADGASWAAVDQVPAKSAVAKGDLTAGTTLFEFFVPKGLRAYQRFNYTVGTGPFTAGKLFGGFQKVH